MNIFYSNIINGKTIELSQQESHHCINVMRNNIGDMVIVLDGKGNKYTATVASKNKTVLLNSDKKESFSSNSTSIHIGISPTKSQDRMDWFIEKSVEIGIDRISFIKTQRTERDKINFNRVNRIAISAMKQSGQYYLPTINNLNSFDEVINSTKEEQLFIAHVEDSLNHHLAGLYSPDKSICLLIGPEGDFTKDEISLAKARKFKSVSLGRSILRTETAGVYSVSLIRGLNER